MSPGAWPGKSTTVKPAISSPSRTVPAIFTGPPSQTLSGRKGGSGRARSVALPVPVVEVGVSTAMRGIVSGGRSDWRTAGGAARLFGVERTPVWLVAGLLALVALGAALLGGGGAPARAATVTDVL